MSVTTSSDKYVNSRDVGFVLVFATSCSKNGGCASNVLAAAKARRNARPMIVEFVVLGNWSDNGKLSQQTTAKSGPCQ